MTDYLAILPGRIVDKLMRWFKSSRVQNDDGLTVLFPDPVGPMTLSKWSQTLTNICVSMYSHNDDIVRRKISYFHFVKWCHCDDLRRASSRSYSNTLLISLFWIRG